MRKKGIVLEFKKSLINFKDEGKSEDKNEEKSKITKELIYKLRKKILITINEARLALLKSKNDIDLAFNLLKEEKTKIIREETNCDLDTAFKYYQNFNGDNITAIEKIMYLKSSKEWTGKNKLKLEELILEIKNIDGLYDLFEIIPLGSDITEFKHLEILADFHSYYAPGELDDLLETSLDDIEEENYIAELKNALKLIDASNFLEYLDKYLDDYYYNDKKNIYEIEKLFWKDEESFFYNVKKNILDNIDKLYIYLNK